MILKVTTTSKPWQEEGTTMGLCHSFATPVSVCGKACAPKPYYIGSVKVANYIVDCCTCNDSCAIPVARNKKEPHIKCCPSCRT